MGNLSLGGFHGFHGLLKRVESAEERLALASGAGWRTEHPPEAVEPDQPRPAPRHHPGVAAKVGTETNLKRR